MTSFAQPQSFFKDLRGESRTEEQNKVLLVANTGWYLYNFRLSLAEELRERGASVVFVSPWDPYVEKIKAEGFWWIELDLNRRSTNPFIELRTVFRLLLIYLVESPTIVHHFTIKCVLYGTLAAKLSRTQNVVNAITGLGYIFINNSIKARLLRLIVQPLYFFTLNARRCRVVVQNQDDLNLLVDRKLVAPEKLSLIRSSGVNLQKFNPSLLQSKGSQSKGSQSKGSQSKNSEKGSSQENIGGQKNSEIEDNISAIARQRDNRSVTILLASRIVGDKGVYEYIEAARNLQAKGHKAVFKMAGALYPGNPSAVSEEEVEQWEMDGVVEWLGHVDNMTEVIAEADIVVLPSHGGEGVPKILIEAAAMAKPLVATDVPGCRDAVDSGRNGFLVPAKSVDLLSTAMEQLIEDAALRQKMGAEGRKKAEAEFDVRCVIAKTLEIYEEMHPIRAVSYEDNRRMVTSI